MSSLTDLCDSLLFKEEGVRLQVYDDKTGKPIVLGYTVQGVPTISVGVALAKPSGLTMDEARYLYGNRRDIAVADAAFCVGVSCWAVLSDVRKVALTSMVFQMGRAGVMKFHTMIMAIQGTDWATAKAQALDSVWAKETPERAEQIAEILFSGEMPS